jgi:hypothetical protein
LRYATTSPAVRVEEAHMEPHKRLWPVVTIRVFAVLNLLMGLAGFYALLSSIVIRLTYDPWPQNPLYLAQAYYFRSAINLFFVTLTILGGIYLWRVHPRGWTICRVLFISQIAYFFLDGFDFPLLLLLRDKASLVSRALAATAGTGNMGTAFQTLTGYPVIALIGLKIAFGKLQRSRASAAIVGAPPAGA